MNIKIILSVALISVVMNGCLIDRIKQKVYHKSLKNRDINRRSKKLYKPTPSTLKVEEKFIENKTIAPSRREKSKISKKSKNSVDKSSKKVAKKSKTKHIKKKIKPEPYSIEKDETDPELLGPQSTLDSNPLKRSKEKVKKKVKEKVKKN